MKQQSTERAFDYSKPLPATSFELIEESDNGKSKILKFKCLTSFFIQEYKYGNGWGFKFITEFKNEAALKNPLSVTGKQIIYSSTLDSDCTPFGRFLEFSLSKINVKDMAKHPAPTPPEKEAIGEHTPGEWEFEQCRGNNRYEHRVFSRNGGHYGSYVIAQLGFNKEEKEPEEIKANAALICEAVNNYYLLRKENEELKAANTELLEALKLAATRIAVTTPSMNRSKGQQKDLETINAAIAKHSKQ